jgi:hypothetical protein
VFRILNYLCTFFGVENRFRSVSKAAGKRKGKANLCGIVFQVCFTVNVGFLVTFLCLALFLTTFQFSVFIVRSSV